MTTPKIIFRSLYYTLGAVLASPSSPDTVVITRRTKHEAVVAKKSACTTSRHPCVESSASEFGCRVSPDPTIRDT
ncbi:hypothetical protein N7510_006268 [Penicillium lagena]|uniref:uncharacterized protein n=1 Tax=Penicillium lagena TaxID=94218 RepID=UPI002541CCC9|nr:uncharacterized protein N7510_006268 [Penicillium lagena]KAJ5613074.1 hypothetical protein N7510_006268 [Penicillium lagena]